MLETTEGGLEKLAEVTTWRDSRLFSEAERLALEYAERITWTDQSFSQLNRFISMHALSFVHFNLIHLTNWVINALPERFPKLKTIWIESGLAWIPYLMQRLDHEVLGAEHGTRGQDGEVEALGPQLGHGLRPRQRLEPHPHARMGAAQRGDGRQHQAFEWKGTARHGQLLAGAAADMVQSTMQVLHARDDPRRLGQDHAAERSGLRARAPANEQLATDRPLGGRNAPGQRGLRHPQRAGRPREAAMVGNCGDAHEIADVERVHRRRR